MSATQGVLIFVEAKDAFKKFDDVGKAINNLGKGMNAAKEGVSKFGTVLANLGVVGGDTSKVLGGLLGGLAGGGLMGVALAGVQMLAARFGEAKKQAADLAKEVSTVSEKIADAYREAATNRKILDLQLQSAGTKVGSPEQAKLEDEIARQKIIHDREKERIEIIRQEAELRDKIAKMEKDKVPYDTQRTFRDQKEELGKRLQESFELQKKELQLVDLKRKQREDAEAAEKAAKKATESRQAADKKLADSKTKDIKVLTSEHEAEISALEAQKDAADEIGKVRIDNEIRLSKLRFDLMMAEREGEAELSASIQKRIELEEKGGQQRLMQLRAEKAIKDAEETRKLSKEIDDTKRSMNEKFMTPEQRIDSKYDTIKGNAQNEIGNLKHQKSMAGMGGESTADLDARIKKYEELIQVSEQAKAMENWELKTQQWTKALEPVGQAFSSLFDGIMQGGTKMRYLIENMFKQMASSVISSLMQMAVQAIVSHVVQKPAKMGDVSAAAGVAGANAAAAMAGIPIVGPALAAAAMAQTSALVLGSMMPLAAAARGFDVPMGVNPVTQLHQKEMVLPAVYADRIRNMTEMPTSHVTNNYISAMDGKDVQRVLRRNAKAVTKTIRREQKGRRF